MGATLVGQHARRSFSAGVPVAAVDDAESSDLRRPSSALSHHSDPVYLVSRSANRREDFRGPVCESRRVFLLLAGGAIRNPLSLDLANSNTRMLGAVFVSHEHDQGAAVRNHLSRPRNLFSVREKILA